MEYTRASRAIWFGLLMGGFAATSLAACTSHHRVATSTSTTTTPTVSATTGPTAATTAGSKTHKAAPAHSTGRTTSTTKPRPAKTAKPSTAAAGPPPAANGPVGAVAPPAAHTTTTRPHPAPPTTVRTVPPTTAPPTTVHHQPVLITISNFAFSPMFLPITRGTTVEVVNHDTTTHTWTSCVEKAGQCVKSGVWDSGNLVPGAAYSFTFSSAGTYMYECTIHTFMTGSIKVS
jgi:plastocyanin